MLTLPITLTARLSRTVLRLRSDRRGLETLEWAVVGAAVIMGAVAGYSVLVSSGIGGFFHHTGTAFANVHVKL